MSLMHKSFGLSVVLYFLLLAQITDANLGANCKSTVECGSPLLQCVNSKCQCWDPYIPDTTNTVCSIAIDGVCQSLIDVCYDVNASCNKTTSIWDTSYCACNEGYKNHPDTRICLPSLGSICSKNGPNCQSGSCIDGTCQCGKGLIASENNDSCGVAIGGMCTILHQTCVDPNAACGGFGRLCQCQDGYQTQNTNGLTTCKSVLGALCNSTSECATTNTTCEVLRQGISVCTCEEGFVPSTTRTSCLPVASTWPGKCTENLQCSSMFGRYSSCRANVCKCKGGYTYSADDVGCVPIYSAVLSRSNDAIKLLATTLLPYLPSEAQLAIEEILDEL